MTGAEALRAHLASGATTVARAYRLERADGQVLGFTDHDRDLAFDGVSFAAGSGLSAKAVQQMTGLAVDNSEAVGALRSDRISEVDILAGRYDRAEVTAWLVNWADVSERAVIFRGSLGEITRGGGAFTAELRGLSDVLNQPQGLIFHGRCSAIRGDKRCRFDLGQPGYRATATVGEVDEGRLFRLGGLAGFDDRFFEKGRLRVLDGAAAGLFGVIKNDRIGPEARSVELWQALAIVPAAGDRVEIEAGCDKSEGMCRLKFGNFLNFRGFPDIPGEDWLMAFPTAGALNDGGSRTR